MNESAHAEYLLYGAQRSEDTFIREKSESEIKELEQKTERRTYTMQLFSSTMPPPPMTGMTATNFHSWFIPQVVNECGLEEWGQVIVPEGSARMLAMMVNWSSLRLLPLLFRVILHH
jgi:hypothetical protein